LKLMKDTLPDIEKIQLAIILSKSESERFRIGYEMNTFGRKVLEGSILQEYPGISWINLKIEVFKRCYSSFYSPEELNRIIHSMREYLKGQHNSPGGKTK
jgi:hypothetical protein